LCVGSLSSCDSNSQTYGPYGSPLENN
jgi:hypothetical protein